MKKLFFIISSITIIFLTSCSKNEGYSLDKYWINLATVGEVQQSDAYYLQLDNGTVLRTTANDATWFEPSTGERVIANYTILSEKQNGAYNYDVRLNDISSVLTKDIIDLTADNQDSIGNDPLRVTNIWIGGNYLNVVFNFFGNNKTHLINLVHNTTATPPVDGTFHLELRQNAYGDAQTSFYQGIASFRLNYLSTINTVINSITVSILDYNGNIKTYKLPYTPSASNHAAMEVKGLTLNEFNAYFH